MVEDVAVITVTYNSAADLASHAAGRLKRHRWIVVDNNSTDNSAAIAEGLGAHVISLESNVGFSAANNIGVQATSADTLVFANPDIILSDELVSALSQTVRTIGGLVAPQLTNPDGSSQENGRGFPYIHRKVAHLLHRFPQVLRKYCIVNDTDRVQEVVWLMGALVAVSRRDFDRIGGWDPTFFVYYEDADLCLRARRAGMPVAVDGSLRAVHQWSRATGRGFQRSAWALEIRSAISFYSRYPYFVVPGYLPRWARPLRRLESP